MQIDAGAIGVCTATVWEAIVMSRTGIEDVYIANEVGGTEKIKALAREAKRGRLSLAVDNKLNADDLSTAARAEGSELGVLIEIDVGGARGGVRSADEGVVLAQHLSKLSNLRFLGVQGYEGHCMLEPDLELRIKKAKQARDHMGEVIEQLAKAGFECKIVSGGGTGTYNLTGADPRMTEIQAGSYVFMDNFHGNLVPGFLRSLTVLSKYPDYEARGFHEEHALFDIDEKCKLKLGDKVEFTPGYAPSTVNLYDVFHVVEDDVVIDFWPIIPRGPGHIGIIEG
jgi:3-hydroxy-D-aspartate aldolase